MLLLFSCQFSFCPIKVVIKTLSQEFYEKVCAFIEQYCLIPERTQVGQPIKLMKFRKQFILDVDDAAAKRFIERNIAEPIVSKTAKETAEKKAPRKRKAVK